MTVLLYPRLPSTVARLLAEERATMSLEDLEKASELTHRAVVYAPTGGNRVTQSALAGIRDRINDCARRCGYPGQGGDDTRQAFDYESGVILHREMRISPYDASMQAVWAFVSCVMLPHIVRWRFPGKGDGTRTSTERFLGGARGLRNTFGRVWWRAYTLSQPNSPDPYHLLRLLHEDELVQIMERASVAGSRDLAQQVAVSFLRVTESHPEMPRMDLLRDAMKRVRRLLPVMSFDALDQEPLQETVEEVFERSVIALQGRG